MRKGGFDNIGHIFTSPNCKPLTPRAVVGVIFFDKTTTGWHDVCTSNRVAVQLLDLQSRAKGASYVCNSYNAKLDETCTGWTNIMLTYVIKRHWLHEFECLHGRQLWVSLLKATTDLPLILLYCTISKSGRLKGH